MANDIDFAFIDIIRALELPKMKDELLLLKKEIPTSYIVLFSFANALIKCDLYNEALNYIDKIDSYYVLEISSVLVTDIKQKLQNIHPKYASKVKWLDKLPTDFNGVIIANELLDANPIDSYVYKNNEITVHGEVSSFEKKLSSSFL